MCAFTGVRSCSHPHAHKNKILDVFLKKCPFSPHTQRSPGSSHNCSRTPHFDQLEAGATLEPSKNWFDKQQLPQSYAMTPQNCNKRKVKSTAALQLTVLSKHRTQKQDYVAAVERRFLCSNTSCSDKWIISLPSRSAQVC